MTRQEKQRADALAHANDVRIARASVRSELRQMPSAESQRTLAAILRDPPDFMLGAPIFKVLVMCRRMGKFRAERILDRQHVDGLRRVGAMTVREREAVAVELDCSADRAAAEAAFVAAPSAPMGPILSGPGATFCPRCQVEALAKHNGECVWCDARLIVREVAA